jgi:hypothetical protein
MNDDIREELSRFDQDYKPEMMFRPSIDQLPNGNYEFEIVSVGIERTTKSNELIFRISLRANGGSVWEWSHFPKDQKACNKIGYVLSSLGLERWFAKGQPFSRGIDEAVNRLKGLKFTGQKVANVDSRDSKKVYHDIIVVSLTKGRAATGSPPTQAETRASTPPPRSSVPETMVAPQSNAQHTNSGEDDQEIPFMWLIPLMPFFLLASQMT